MGLLKNPFYTTATNDPATGSSWIWGTWTPARSDVNAVRRLEYTIVALAQGAAQPPSGVLWAAKHIMTLKQIVNPATGVATTVAYGPVVIAPHSDGGASGWGIFWAQVGRTVQMQIAGDASARVRWQVVEAVEQNFPTLALDGTEVAPLLWV